MVDHTPRLRRMLILWGGIVVFVVISAFSLYYVYGESTSMRIKNAITEFIREKVKDAAKEVSHGRVKVDLNGFSYGFFDGSVHVDSIVASFADSTNSAEQRGLVLELHIPQVDASKVFPWDVLNGGGLSIGTITVRKPSVRVHSWGLTDSVALTEADTSVLRLPQIPNLDSVLHKLTEGMLPADLAPLTIASIQIQDASMDRLAEDIEHSGYSMQSYMTGLSANISRVTIGAGQAVGAQVLRGIDIEMDALDRYFADGRIHSIHGLHIQVLDNDSLLTIDSVKYSTPDDYSFTAIGAHFSFRNHSMGIDSISVGPTRSDAEYLTAHRNMTDRFRLNVHKLQLEHIDLDALTRGAALHVRNINVSWLQADVLSNMRKKDQQPTAKVTMPHEFLRTLPFVLEVDTISVNNGKILFGELHLNSVQPGKLYWDGLRVKAVSLTTNPQQQHDSPFTITASGTFMGQAHMQATFRLPLDVRAYRLEAEGSLTKLDITRLNTFLPIAENIRIASGVASKATFKFVVNGRRAVGIVDPYYTNLKIELVDAKTKKTDFLKDILSFATNWIVLRNDNLPGKDHEVGKIEYVLPANAAMMQTLWFPLRSGLQDVAGF